MYIDGINYDVVIERKKIKNMYLRFKDGYIYITANKYIKDSEISLFLKNNVKSIEKMIQQSNNKKKYEDYLLGKKIDVVVVNNLKQIELVDNVLYIDDKNKLDYYIKLLANKIFLERLNYWYQKMGDFKCPELKIRKMKSKWGVNNKKAGTITLNLDLIYRSLECIDYVVIHELSHCIHFNHSKSFWETVEVYCPNYKKIKKELKE